MEGIRTEQSGCARQVAQINCGIEAARVHIQRNQTHLESLRRRYGVAWPRAVRSVSRTTARRFGQIDVARSQIWITGEVGFSTRKTGRRILLPLVQPLADYLALCQRATTRTLSFSLAPLVRSARLVSNQLRDVLITADLFATARTRKHGQRAQPSARSERDFVSLVTPFSGDDAKSGGRF